MQSALHEADAGQAEQARALYHAVLDLLPGHAAAHFGLGMLERRRGEAGAAIPHFANALQAAPDQESYWLAYIDALMEARQFVTARELVALGRQHGLQGAAVDAFERQLANCGEPTPQEIEAAAALYAQGRPDEAGEAARALTERFPQHPFGWKLLGAIQYKRRALTQALASMRKAVQYGPEDAETLSNFGLMLKRAGQLQESRQILEQAISLQPGNGHAHNHLAGTLMEMGCLADAHACASKAVELAPRHVEAWITLAIILDNLGRSGEAIEAYRRVLEQNPDHHDAHDNLLFCLSHMADLSPEALFAEHRNFGQRLEARTGPPPAWDNPPIPERRLRIGFVSGDLRNHAVSSFVEPIFRRLAARPGLELIAYYNHPVQDSVTAHLRSLVPHWRDVAELGDAALDALVRADGIDILIDLSGHTAHNRLPLFARKPAPLQASWIGYPGTTGLSTMDYLLADQHLVPPGQFDGQFTEKLVLLPLSSGFMPAADAPDLAPPPALANGYLTFGSFNRLSKFSRPVVAVWGQLLRALPDTRLLMAGMPQGGGGHEQLQAWLRAEGIDAGRVRFHPRTRLHDYLALHNEVDICLDTFPYSGGTTTLHALYMGVPTLTLAGRTMAGRQTVCILEHHGLAQFIARDAEDFVRKGVAASQDLEALAALRAGLRADSPLWAADTVPRVVDALENALRLMWRRWCAGLPPAAFTAPLVLPPAGMPD